MHVEAFCRLVEQIGEHCYAHRHSGKAWDGISFSMLEHSIRRMERVRQNDAANEKQVMSSRVRFQVQDIVEKLDN